MSFTCAVCDTLTDKKRARYNIGAKKMCSIACRDAYLKAFQIMRNERPLERPRVCKNGSCINAIPFWRRQLRRVTALVDPWHYCSTACEKAAIKRLATPPDDPPVNP